MEQQAAFDWEHIVRRLKSSVTIADARAKDCPLIYVNQQFVELTGYEENEVIGKNCRFLQGPATDPEAVGRLREAIAKRESATVELLNYCKDGRPFWNEVNLDPIFDTNGECIYFVGIQFEITDRKLAQQQLVEAAAAADAANEAKSRFIANMSHEIRTPLNGIMGMTDLMMLTDMTLEQQENMHIIQNCADTLLLLMNDILDLSKIEANKLVTEQIEVNIRELVDTTVKAHLPIAAEKRLSIVSHVLPEVPRQLLGDPNRLRQVLNNLLGNAVKFTDTGIISIVVRLAGIEDRTVTLQFEIQDTGIGISPADHGKLFKSFSQVDDSHTRKYGGTGLGLAISKQLVELMGGQISVQSESGAGSLFMFTVPYKRMEQWEEEQVDRNDMLQTEQSLHILLVEDDEVSQIVTSRMLVKLGHTVQAAFNGKHALELLEQNDFDLVLMDIQMPVLNGYDTARAIRADKSKGYARLPIVALTAHAFKENHIRILSAGMNDTLAKPLKLEELHRVIEALKREEAHRPELE
ncbi:ATP-binding protein [Paenibacillus sp. SYP-B4298]|uniref:ATP-binding protein n=1 Tax=Paenibacillus sp. SYP-B4298 TaxID=2996034 RepID=UPI0022DCF1DB|nr:ATP-binding protein [Paenibacillus sp. SYP-B4298]